MPKTSKSAAVALSYLIAELDTMIELLNCDCMEYMATVPDKYFDLAIVDPPYGIGCDGVGMSGRKSNSVKFKNYQGSSYTGVYRDWETDRKSTRLNSSHSAKSRMPSSA